MKNILNFNFASYYKIKLVAESCENYDHVEVLCNMFNNFIHINEYELYSRRSKVFSINIFKWLNNYKKYNEYLALYTSMEYELRIIIEDIIKQYNQFVQEQKELELNPPIKPPVIVKGFIYEKYEEDE